MGRLSAESYPEDICPCGPTGISGNVRVQSCDGGLHDLAVGCGNIHSYGTLGSTLNSVARMVQIRSHRSEQHSQIPCSLQKEVKPLLEIFFIAHVTSDMIYIYHPY